MNQEEFDYFYKSIKFQREIEEMDLITNLIQGTYTLTKNCP